MSNFLVIPLEIQKREIAPACNLVVEALKKNLTIYLGQKQQIFPFIKDLPKSVWYLKSLVPGENALIKKIKKEKHIVTSLDIEGLIPYNLPQPYKHRYSKENINLADKIFFWGNWHYKNFCYSFKKIKKNKLCISGSPVVDEWLKSKKFNKIKQKKQILVIPSFGKVYSKTKQLNYRMVLDNLGIKKISDKKNKINKKFYSYIKLDIDTHDKAYKSFLNLIPELCKNFTNYKIVLRPHPNENMAIWKNIQKKYSNLIINNREDQSKQILTSEVVIHFNSTMSVQSRLLGKKVITFFSISKNNFKSLSPITKKVSVICKNIKEIKKEINKKNKNYNSILSDIVSNIQFDNNNSSKKIISQLIEFYDKIDNTHLKKKDIHISNLNNYFSFFYYFIINNYIVPFLSFFSFLSFFKRFSHGDIFRKYKISRKEMIKKKWPGLSIDELMKHIAKASKGRSFKKKIEIYKHFSGMFIIRQI